MNMSYCRFENTLGDLRDCFEAMQEMREAGPALDGYDPNDEDGYNEELERLKLSEREESARIELVKLAIQIAAEFGDTITPAGNGQYGQIERDWEDARYGDGDHYIGR